MNFRQFIEMAMSYENQARVDIPLDQFDKDFIDEAGKKRNSSRCGSQSKVYDTITRQSAGWYVTLPVKTHQKSFHQAWRPTYKEDMERLNLTLDLWTWAWVVDNQLLEAIMGA